MTNQMIILTESIKLMEAGILKPTGEKIVVETDEGKKELDVPEIIHTYQKWKQLGYQVKKGQKAIAQFPVWKYTNKKTKDNDNTDGEKENGYCFLKVSSFFKQEQVEQIVN